MAEEQLRIVYDGPAVDAGRMDVRELAPSLLALADLFHQAQAQLYPEDPRITVELRATEEGSFVADISVVHSFMDHFRTIFGGDTATATANLIALGGFVGGVLTAIVKLAGRAIRNRRRLANGMTRLELEDGTFLELPSQVVEMLERALILKLARDFIQPLRRDDMEQIRVQHRDTQVAITSGDVPAFDRPLEEDVLVDTTSTMILSVVSLAFDPDNKWRLSDGHNRFYVTINDQEFLGRVQRDEERFAKGDYLEVDLRIVQTQEPDGRIRTERFAERVRHIAAIPYEQGSLHIVADDEDDDTSD